MFLSPQIYELELVRFSIKRNVNSTIYFDCRAF
ncbi:hypothetical protein FHS60_001493 [Alloprevotella rava]|uniref:Uncharacterized protein n=1 Tax=Alloprevotella rava TaxID=671218 RepID=A0A7W5UJF9_9BACT|nr:hypothetical protein [Alloprevotella rava]